MDMRKHLDARAADTAAPTPAQADAGNYRKGRVKGHGLDIVIETPRGALRRGVDGKTGKPWQVRSPCHYGYISRTVGADGDHVDCYIGPHLKSSRVFVMDQRHAHNGEYDEAKVFFGFASERQVKALYRRCFSDGKADARMGPIAEFTPDEFRDWLKYADTKKPIHRANGGRVGYADGGAEDSGWFGRDSALGKFGRLASAVYNDPSLIPQIGAALVNPSNPGSSIVQSIKSGAAAPADAYSGNMKMWDVDPETGEARTSDQAIERSMDVAGLAGGSGFGNAAINGAEKNALGIVPVGRVKEMPTPTAAPNEFMAAAVENTPGAKIDSDGHLIMNVRRNQRPEQAMEESVRGGVFYLPEGSKDAKYYTGKGFNYSYGGDQKIVGETAFKNPIVVKGATGGKAPEAAYDSILGKGSYQGMRTDALRSVGGGGLSSDLKAELVEQFLEKYAPDMIGMGHYIAQNSQKGNQLAYALQEAAVGSAVRKAGYDGVIGFSVRRSDKKPFISEAFDVRESHYPTPEGDYQVHPQFLESTSPPSAPPLPMDEASRMARAAEQGYTVDAYKGGQPHDWDTMPVRNGRGDIIPGTENRVPQELTQMKDRAFFSDNPDVANRFAAPFEHGAVWPTKLKFENPLVIDAKGQHAAAFQFDTIARERGTSQEMKAFKDALTSGEYDGVILKNTKDEGTVYVPINGSQVRSRFAAFDPANKGKSGLLLSDTTKPGMAVAAAGHSQPFYSAVERAVEGINQPRMTGDAWLGTLRNKPGVKPEELEWTGLKKFLESKRGQPVTKQEVADHLASNKVELGEVNKGGDKSWDKLSSREQDAIADAYTEHTGSKINTTDPEVRNWYEENQARGHEDNQAKLSSKTKYDQYQLPGGTNYRELLLTMPPKTRTISPAETQEIADFRAMANNLDAPAPTRAELRRYDELIRKQHDGDNSLNYKSTHWDEPNVLAHMRMSDRLIGNHKSLHLDEIQSDWHQQGRDKGYRKDTKGWTAEWADEPKFSHASWNVKDADGNIVTTIVGPKDSTPQSIIAAAAKGAVPDAPFEKTWHELALKRAVYEAATKGYDRLSWTPGEAQAARYDLSKQVDQILAWKNPDGTFEINADPRGRSQQVSLGKSIPADEVANHVGKELAEKITGIKRVGGTANIFKGGDLKIGGEGMTGFYDQIVPKAIERLLKKHGVKVQKGEVGGATKPVYEGDVPHTRYFDDIARDLDQRGTVSIFHQWQDVRKAVRDGQDVREAIAEHGSPALAQWLGGKIKETAGDKQPVWYIDIPDSLKKQAKDTGFALFSDTGHGMAVSSLGHQFNNPIYHELAVQQRNRGMATGKSAKGWDVKRPDSPKGTWARHVEEAKSGWRADRDAALNDYQWESNQMFSPDDRAFMESGQFRRDGGRVAMAQGGKPDDDFVVPPEDDFVVPEESGPQVSGARALGEGYLSGASGNFRDEWYGASKASGLPDWLGGFRAPVGAARMMMGDEEANRVYERERDYARGVQKAAEEQHPWAYGTGEVVGNVGGMALLPEAKALQGSGRAAQLARGTVLGAEVGAISGAGEGENLDERITGAGLGAGIGAGAGVVGTGVGALTGAAYDKLGRPIVSAVRGAKNPEAEATRRLVAALQADGELIAAGRAKGMTLQEWAAARQAGEPVTFADLGAGNTQSLLRSAANTSPEGRAILEKVINDRFKGQSDRVANDIRGLVNGGANAGKTADQLVAEYDVARGPAYKAAFRHPKAQGLWDGEFEQMATAPAVQNAIAMATVNARNEAAKIGLPPPPNPFVRTKDGYMVLKQVDPNDPLSAMKPNLQFWDVVKKNLDSGDRQSQQWAKVLRDKLDSYNTGYDRARGIAATFFGERDALQAGRTLAGKKIDPEVLRSVIQKMNPQERDLFREGYASDWSSRVIGEMRDTADITKAMFNSPNERKRAMMIFGPSGIRKIEARMALEVIMDGARQAMGNSTTARQLIEAGLAGGALVSGYESGWDPKHMLQGAGIGAGLGIGASRLVATGLASSAKKFVGKVDARTARRVAELLTSSNPAELRYGLNLAVRNNKIAEGLRQIANRIAGGAKASTARSATSGALHGAESMVHRVPMQMTGSAPAYADQDKGQP